MSKVDNRSPNKTTYYQYSGRDRLVEVTEDVSGAVTTLGQFDYNHEGNRIRHRYSDRGNVDYFYDDGSVLVERNADDNSLLAHYQYADRLIALAQPLGKQYYHHDALGSTIGLTGATGADKKSYRLDPWGNIRAQSGTSDNRHIFTGQEHDPNTGLVYFGSRYYDPEVGRFITQDTYLGESSTPPSLHRYLYAHSNPTVFVDRDGHNALDARADEIQKRQNEAAERRRVKQERLNKDLESSWRNLPDDLRYDPLVKPIVDEEEGVVTGYSRAQDSGYYRIYSKEGEFLDWRERPLVPVYPLVEVGVGLGSGIASRTLKAVRRASLTNDVPYISGGAKPLTPKNLAVTGDAATGSKVGVEAKEISSNVSVSSGSAGAKNLADTGVRRRLRRIGDSRKRQLEQMNSRGRFIRETKPSSEVGNFGSEDVALGLARPHGKSGGLLEFAGDAVPGTRANLSERTRELAPGASRNAAIANDALRFAKERIQKTGGKVRFNLSGFDHSQALNPGSRFYDKITSAEFRGVLSDKSLLSRTRFYRNGVDVTAEILRMPK